MAGAPSVARREQDWNENALAQAPAAPAWHIWRYEAPALVLGCSQRKLLPRGCGRLEVLHRRAGGGAVLVGPWMLGLSVALPRAHALATPGIVDSYRWLGELLRQWLHTAGLHAAELVPPGSAALQQGVPELAWACFGGLSPWEVVAGGTRKIAGLAQVRRREVALLVAGILMAPADWRLLADCLGRPASEAEWLARHTTSWSALQGAAADLGAAADVLDALLAARLDRDT